MVDGIACGAGEEIMNHKPAPPKMNSAQAKLFWKSLTPQQRADFNKMYGKLLKKDLLMTKVMVDDNEQIQRIILEDKDKPGKPAKPFYDHFKLED